MEEKKPWYTSKTIWACIVTEMCAVVSVLAMFNIISAELAVKITGAIGMIAGAVGIQGRINSNTRIG